MPFKVEMGREASESEKDDCAPRLAQQCLADLNNRALSFYKPYPLNTSHYYMAR